jgi:hypothetical protein
LLIRSDTMLLVEVLAPRHEVAVLRRQVRGRSSRSPSTPPPRCPTSSPAATVFSAIDPRIDQHFLDLLTRATTEGFVLCTSALSRYSRNSDKPHRVLEYLLAHNATILTTNYLIRSTDVWVHCGDPTTASAQDSILQQTAADNRDLALDMTVDVALHLDDLLHIAEQCSTNSETSLPDATWRCS